MLLERGISFILEDPALGKKRGFFRALPLLYLKYHPVFTYHGKAWYTKYMKGHGEFHNIFDHFWIHSEEIDNPHWVSEYNTLCILLIRNLIQNVRPDQKETLPTILSRAVKAGFNRIIMGIDNVGGLKLNDKSVRTIESLVSAFQFDNRYSYWLKRVERFLPTIKCRSKSVILNSYGVYEIARSSLKSSSHTKKGTSIETIGDMLNLDFPLIVMDILLKIQEKIRWIYPSTRIQISDIKRFVKPWFDNKREAKQIAIRCYEKIEDLTPKTKIFREKLGKRIEEKLLSWCMNDGALQSYKQIKEVVNQCAV